MKTYTTSNTLTFQCGRQAFCCRNWDICLSREVVERIKTHPEKFCGDSEEISSLYTLLDEKNPLYYAKASLKEGRCVFLTGENTCKIFNAFGKEQGNSLCVEYPFFKFRLKDRKVLVTCLSCTSSIERLFETPAIQTVEVPGEHSSRTWVEMPYEGLPFVTFNPSLRMTWEAYFLLEKHLLRGLSSCQGSPWNFRSKFSTLQAIFFFYKERMIEEEKMLHLTESLSERMPAKEIPSLAVFFHFIHRKINLYHYPPFEKAVKRILCLEKENPGVLQDPEFISSLVSWDSVFQNYLYVKMFSNPLNFSKGVEYCWHVLFFHLGFMKLFLFSIWKEQKRLEVSDLKNAIQTVERHFLHDSRIFQFWGQGRRGEGDFHPHSLRSLII